MRLTSQETTQMQLNNSRPYDALEWVRECAERGESIVGRIIRERNEARARAAARRARMIRLAYVVGLPVALLAGIGLGEIVAALLTR
jgi:hypothetical protein